MRYKSFGKSDLKVSEMGMGCSSLGKSLHRRDEKESLATILKAFDSGINFFDTSPTYSQGDSERLIGEALKSKRDQVIIASKVGTTSTPIGRLANRSKPILRPVNFLFRPVRSMLTHFYVSQRRIDFSRESIVRSTEASLNRLQTDYLDLIQLHHPTASILKSGEFCETFELLRNQGKIRYYGVTCDSVEDALICLSHPSITSIQVVLNLLDLEAIRLLVPLAEEKKVAIIARLPLAQGLLTDSKKVTKAENWSLNRTEFIERKNKSEHFRFLVKENRSLAQAALQFLLQLKGVTVTIPGFNNRRHLEENIGALTAPLLTQEELATVYSMSF